MARKRDEETTQSERPRGASERGTHLLARSRRDRFRRGGIDFTKDWNAWPLDGIAPEQLERIRAQSDEIESRIVSAGEADEYVKGRSTDLERYSKAELWDMLVAANDQNTRLQARVGDLERAFAGSAQPPALGALPGHQVPPLPTPGLPLQGETQPPGLPPLER